jgi:hypothetical protein
MLYNWVNHNLYSLPYTVRVNKSRMRRKARHATCMGETRNAYKRLSENMMERDHFKD